MRARQYALCLFVVGLLVTSYLCWAHSRIRSVALVSERHTWPYPDQWLIRWEQRLDAAHPAAPGTFKIEGELPRMELYLDGWICLSAVATLGSLAWVLPLRRKSRDA
jgi:hypothetical protein